MTALNRMNGRIRPLVLAMIVALSSPTFALTDEEWLDLPGSWKNFHVWVEGADHTGSAAITLENAALKSPLAHGDFRDATIGLVNYSRNAYGEYSGNVTIDLKAANTLSIDMTSNPHAGILVARTSTDRTGAWKGHPSLTVNAGLDISGDVNHQKATDVGDFTAGIAIGLGEVHVKGDLDVNLINMDSQSAEERRQVPYDGEYPTWQQYYGWTVFDDRRGSGSESTFKRINTSYLLQGGVVTGIAAVSVAGNVDITVSGRNGVLGGWIMAPNAELWHETDEWENVAPVDVGGTLTVNASLEENAEAFGLFGVGLQASGNDDDRIGMSFNVAKDVTISIDGGNAKIQPVWSSDDRAYDGTKMLELGNAEALLLDGSSFTAPAVTANVTNVGSAFHAGGIDIRNHGSLYAGRVSVTALLPSEAIDTAYGIYGTNNTGEEMDLGDVTVDVKANAETIYGFYWRDNSIRLTGDTVVSAVRLDTNDAEASPAYAVVVDNGMWDSEVDLTPEAGKHLQLTGDLWVTANNAALRANFNEGSFLRGATHVDLYEDMTQEEIDALFARYPSLWMEDMNLSFGQGSFWDVTGNSQVTHLSLSDGARVILSNHDETVIPPGTGVLPGFGSHVLDIRHFSGVSLDDKENAGIFHLDVNLGETEGVANEGGFITVFGSVDADKPYAVLEVASTGAQLAERSKILVLDSTPEHNLQLELSENPNIGRRAEVGAFLYELAAYEDTTGNLGGALSEYFLSDPENEYGDAYFAESNDVYYYLRKTEETSPTADDTASVASFGLQIAQYLAHLDTLRERLGDIRYGGEHGVWARATATKDQLTGVGGSAYDAETATLMFGADAKLGTSDWTAGALVRFLDSNGEGKGRTNVDTDGQGAGVTLYATHTNPGALGAYLDLTASFDWYDQDLDGVMADGATAYKGSYSTTAWGASTETGFAWRWGDERSWFVEPSAQLSYYAIRGERFMLDNGMVLKQSNTDSLTGRVGLTFGYTSWLDGKRDVEFYGKFGVNHEFLGEEAIDVNDAHYEADILGTRFYYGFGVTKALGSNTVFWAQLSREEGDDYTREYAGNVGIRLNF